MYKRENIYFKYTGLICLIIVCSLFLSSSEHVENVITADFEAVQEPEPEPEEPERPPQVKVKGIYIRAESLNSKRRLTNYIRL